MVSSSSLVSAGDSGAAPTRDPGGPSDTRSAQELAGPVKVAVEPGHRVAVAVQPASEGRPGCAVPLGDVVGARGADRHEAPGRVQSPVEREEGARAGASRDRGPGSAIPLDDAEA